MLQIAICDDNELHRSHAAAMIESGLNRSDLAIRTFAGGSELLCLITEGSWTPDIAILDVELEEESGIALAGRLNELVPGCRIIFLTGHAGYASEAYMTRHVWLVLKERADEFLLPALRKALSMEEPEPAREVLQVRSEGKVLLLPVDSVLYVDRFGRKTRINCQEGRYVTAQPPAKLLSFHLPARFVRCHQGYWVNLSHIAALDHNEFVLDDGTRLPISRTWRDAARARFFDRVRL